MYNLTYGWQEANASNTDSQNSQAAFVAPEYAPGRWDGIKRDYSVKDVERLRGTLHIRHTLAERGAEKLWKLLNEDAYVNTLGAFTGCQAVQHVQAGLKAIYLSGWQVAADANNAGQMYPDQSLYPASSVPMVVERINNAFQRQDQIQNCERLDDTDTTDLDWYAPIIADAEAGFGGPLNCFELMKSMIKAGAAGVHFEDQLSSEKKCGHLGGKVLLPTQQAIRNLNAARLASDVMGVPTLLLARTDAEAAKLITSDIDERDQPFLTGERSKEGFYYVKNGIEAGIARGLSYAPYADLLWMETATPDLNEARAFAEGIHKHYPNKMLAYNCSPSFNWAKHMDKIAMEKFQREIAAMGYKFQFITLAGFHSLNHASFELAKKYKEQGMAGYSQLQEAEFASAKHGFSAVRHQREVGVGYFDAVTNAVSGGNAATTAMADSTETAQF